MPSLVQMAAPVGALLKEQGKSGAALEHLEQALRLEPGMANAHDELGSLWAELGDDERSAHHYEQAIATLEQRVAAHPESPQIHHQLGVVLVELGRRREAARRFERTLELQPDHVRARYALGALCVVYVVNFVDRQVLSILLQSIKADPLSDCPECEGRVRRLIGAGAGFIAATSIGAANITVQSAWIWKKPKRYGWARVPHRSRSIR